MNLYRAPLRAALACLALAMLTPLVRQVNAQPDPTRSDPAFVWALEDLYETPVAWEAARASIETRLPSLADYQGRLGESAEVLQEALDTYFGLLKDFYQIAVYANLKSDEDTRVASEMERRQAVGLLASKFGQASSYMAPELVSVGSDRVEAFISENPDLAPYDHFLRNVLRQSPHVLSAEAENVLASASLVTSAPSNVYNILSNADMPWPSVTLPTGEEVTLNQAGYARLRGHADREVRHEVFEAFWDLWNQFEATYGSILAGDVQAAVFQARARKYDSSLDWSLSSENVPVAVYRTLIEQTNSNLETLYRYFRLRGRMLGVDQMQYYDIYPPLVQADLQFSVDEAKEITLEALRPLGPEYLSILERGFGERWMHVYPQPGKRSGAYMSGSAYDVHPYLLLNYNEDYNSLSTFGHEWGHAVHTVLASEAQPFSKYDYSTFTAEIASTINEVLLENYMIEHATTDEEKLFYLGQVLESLRGTFFRQAMFAEFELAIHEEIEAGRPLSGEKLTEIYGNLLKKYHGHDQGVVHIDDKYAVEWAYILHFFNYNYYVYQYATSIAGGIYFADNILKGGEEEREAFLDVLRAGGSDYAYEILQDVGIDMATPAPYQALVARMNTVMDEIEEILDRRG